MTLPSPVPPIDAIGKLAAGTAGPQAATPQVGAELAQKFGELMKNHQASPDHGLNALDEASRVVKTQQDQLTALQTNMIDTIEHANALAPADRFEAFARLTMDTSVAHMKISLSTGVTKTSNKSLQTLLKNE